MRIHPCVSGVSIVSLLVYVACMLACNLGNFKYIVAYINNLPQA
jgi:hypothetical protein